ncbi:MAG TPA: right-handed parallel beta-helix repeat-containing protein [Phenylobacterium sp.]|jgi:parallel beta-helix repeat protein|uniref:right-handed parallel beta-helix repeat-containing protein n=1 Tax=Phenylobacterium sp. TaxID=1871053 RepID=UPI002D28DA8A|nr:right-handed parallel beta-helix repeat-containing protein [Phenylobacterium sp.]HZZ69129.1 right-handed parallel beta-helix repeat-containing protein [Phenylobacterium sp.]
MSDITVNSAAGLTAALNTAHAGDTIELAAGNYGDVLIQRMNFAQGVTIESASSSAPATLHSLTVLNSSGLTFSGLDVNYTATTSTVSYSSAVRFNNSTNIVFQNSTVVGGNAITGVAQDAKALDSTNNVIGLPTGRGVTVEFSTGVTLNNDDLGHLFRGVVVTDSSNTTIENSNIHDTRTSSIVGSAVNGLVINNNQLSDSNPWHWGQTGDHADFIHIWTDSSEQTTASNGIQITNNNITQGAGTAILGVYLQDLGGEGFTGVNISNNEILNGNANGIRVENTSNSQIENNTLLQTSGGTTDGPGISDYLGSHNLTISGNQATFVQDVAGTDAGHLTNNTIVQMVDPGGAGYYTPSEVASLETSTHTVAVNQATITADLADHATPAELVSDFATTAAADSTVGIKITGKSSADQFLTGTGGNDTIVGLSGNDFIIGGGGNDYINSGAGNDTISGGAGADSFVFSNTNVTGGGETTILDFSHADGDKINVHAIDANTNLAGDQNFQFIGTAAFTHTAGQLHYTVVGSDAYVSGDVNGDGVADFTIHLTNVHSLMSSDFVL